MKAKRNIVICSAVLCTVLAISCSDDGGDDPEPQGGSAGVAGDKTEGGSAGKSTAGSSNGGSVKGGSGGSAGKDDGGEGGQVVAGSSTGGAAGGEGGGGGDDAGGSGGEGGNTEPTIDCSLVPDKPIMVQELKGPKAYHDIAFDTLGNLIGNDNEDLLKSALDGKPKLMLAGVGMVQGFDQAVNGDLFAVASSSEDGHTSLLRITPEGGQETVIAVEMGAYGVRIGPDGFIYVASSDALLRVDPVTKKTTLVPSDVESWVPRVMDYSPDKKKLYVGTLGDGDVYAYDLDENGKTKGYPKKFAEGVGDGYHDGLGVDACGNVYVADYYTSALYRITPEGEVSLYHDWTDTTYGHGMEWGSGHGGYEKTSLYLPQPYDNNTVVRVELGVPARPR